MNRVQSQAECGPTHHSTGCCAIKPRSIGELKSQAITARSGSAAAGSAILRLAAPVCGNKNSATILRFNKRMMFPGKKFRRSSLNDRVYSVETGNMGGLPKWVK